MPKGLLQGGRARSLAAIVAIVLAMIVIRLPFWSSVEGTAFDLFSTTGQPVPAEPGFVVVAIDEPSFSAVGQPWPWPRDLHARLVEALRAAGANVIGFDVVFAEPTDPLADAALGRASDRRVVFAADESVMESEQASSVIRTEPIPELVSGGGAIGVTSVALDRDGVARSVARYPDSLPRMLIEAGGKRAPPPGDARQRIQYFGPAGSYPRVSYYQALEPARYLPPGYFKGKNVIVGFALQATADVSGGTDMFETPYTLETGQLTPGVEVQATVADNLANDLSIALPPSWLALVLAALGGILGLAVSLPRRQLNRALLALGTFVLLVAASWLALRYGRLWLSPAEPALSLLGVIAGIAGVDFAEEQRRRREIQGAFSQYISPAMVEQLVADPSLLKLGGERKQMSILFADIRGFTSISEAMKDDPEGLTSIINDILNPLSDIVIAQGGTIDKYMGDCIMAFWNAPLDDPDHALHAAQTAIAMVEALPAINTHVQSRLPEPTGGGDKPTIRIGVGVNSGDCVVGNMGSAHRFDYSVLGDAVNLASRIESLCKEYGVPLILGEETAALLNGALPLAELDRVAVRGKATPTALHTIDRPGFRREPPA
jgi:adenylate cyclase